MSFNVNIFIFSTIILVIAQCYLGESPPQQNSQKTQNSGPTIILPNLNEHITRIAQDFAHDNIANAVSMTFKWAENHFPLVVKLLQLAKSMGEDQVENIPGAKAFMDILAETFQWHMTRAKLEKYNLTTTDFRNKSIEDTIEEFQKNHNYSIAEIPIIKNLTKEFLKLPAVKDLARQAMTVQIEGVPFAITLFELINHLTTQIPVQHLANRTVLEGISQNLTRVIKPFAESQVQRHFELLKNGTKDYLSNLTELGQAHYQKAGQVAKNLTDTFNVGLDMASKTAEDVAKMIWNKTQKFHENNIRLTREELEELQEHIISAGKMAPQILSNPMGVASEFAGKAQNFTKNTIERMSNFTGWLGKLTSSHLEEVGMISDRARNFSVHTVSQFTSIGQGLVEHAQNSLHNLTEITKNMSPLQMFRFKSIQALIDARGEGNKTLSFLESIPFIGSIPGVSLISSFFENCFKMLLG